MHVCCPHSVTVHVSYDSPRHRTMRCPAVQGELFMCVCVCVGGGGDGFDDRPPASTIGHDQRAASVGGTVPAQHP